MLAFSNKVLKTYPDSKMQRYTVLTIKVCFFIKIRNGGVIIEKHGFSFSGYGSGCAAAS